MEPLCSSTLHVRISKSCFPRANDLDHSVWSQKHPLKPFCSVVELNVAIIVSCVPGFSKFLRTMETDWRFVKLLRSKLEVYRSSKLMYSYKSSQKDSSPGSSQPQGSTSNELGVPVPAYPPAVAGHSKANSLSYAYNQMYNSWELDSYLDIEDRRASSIQSGSHQGHTEDGIAGEYGLLGQWDGRSHV